MRVLVVVVGWALLVSSQVVALTVGPACMSPLDSRLVQEPVVVVVVVALVVIWGMIVVVVVVVVVA